MNDEYALCHCLMVSQEAGEGTPVSATIWYLDWLDDQGVPHAEHLSDGYQGFKRLGADGWRLVQVIERPASEGIWDGLIGPGAYYYLTRPAGTEE